jgi:hypothetical protein
VAVVAAAAAATGARAPAVMVTAGELLGFFRRLAAPEVLCYVRSELLELNHFSFLRLMAFGLLGLRISHGPLQLDRRKQEIIRA